MPDILEELYRKRDELFFAVAEKLAAASNTDMKVRAERDRVLSLAQYVTQNTDFEKLLMRYRETCETILGLLGPDWASE